MSYSPIRFNDILLSLFNDPKVSFSFLQNCLSNPLPDYLHVIDTVEPQDTRVVQQPSLETVREGDILLKVTTKGPLGTFLCSIEFQSRTDSLMGIRLANYQSGYLLKWVKQEDRLLPLVSILFFHGSGIFDSFSKVYKHVSSILRPHIVTFEPKCTIINLSEYSDERLFAFGDCSGLFVLLKHSDNLDEVVLEKVMPLLMENTLETRRECLLFFSSRTKIGKEKFNRIVSKYIGEKEMMTLAQTWWEDARLEGMEAGMQEGIQKGIQKGMQKGMRKGKLEARIDIARNMLAANYLSLEDIARYTLLSLEMVEELKSNNGYKVLVSEPDEDN